MIEKHVNYMLLVLYNFIDRTIQTFLFDVKENYRQNAGKSMELLYLIDLSRKTATEQNSFSVYVIIQISRNSAKN